MGCSVVPSQVETTGLRVVVRKEKGCRVDPGVTRRNPETLRPLSHHTPPTSKSPVKFVIDKVVLIKFLQKFVPSLDFTFILTL